MADNDLTPEIVNGNQKVTIGGLPVELSPQLLQALSGSGAMTNLNPMADVMALIDEPRGALIPMAVTGVIERAKSRIQLANLTARRRFIEERTTAIRAVQAQITAAGDLAETLLTSGNLNELQRIVLSLQYPRIARTLQRTDELAELKHQVAVTAERVKLERLTQRSQPKDYKAAAEARLTRQRDESLMTLQHGMTGAVQFVQMARSIRDQINQGQFSTDEKGYLEGQLEQLLAQLHLDQHGANGR